MKYQINLHVEQDIDEAFGNPTVAAQAVLTAANALPGELTIVITHEKSMQDLNRRFAQVDAPTDVLSFVDGSRDPESGRLYYGDVIIALPVAKSQAETASHPLESEVALLTIHGVLHLLGYDHDEPSGHVKMWHIQKQVLDQLGIRVNIPGDPE